MLKRFLPLLVLAVLAFRVSATNHGIGVQQNQGYRHESIDSGRFALTNLAARKQLCCWYYRECRDDFNEANWKKNIKRLFSWTQRAMCWIMHSRNEFMRFIQSGGVCLVFTRLPIQVRMVVVRKVGGRLWRSAIHNSKCCSEKKRRSPMLRPNLGPSGSAGTNNYN